jgi:hypothetical protein
VSDKRVDKKPLPAVLSEKSARLATEWEADRDYAEAIQQAESGDPTRLINRLRAKRRLTDGDYDALARYLERGMRQSRPGAPGDKPMRNCARLADALLETPIFHGRKSRHQVVEYARQAYEKWSGFSIDPAELKARMNRPKSRRQ